MVLDRLKSFVGLSGGWDQLLAQARRDLFTSSNPAKAERLVDVLASAPDSFGLRAKSKGLARVYESLARWRATHNYVRPFEGLNDARVQFWELEHNCAVLAYQKLLARDMVDAFPNSAGLRKNQNILDHTPDVAPDAFFDQAAPLSVMETPDAERTIIAFSGLTNICLGVGWTTFYRAVAVPAKANLIVLKDFDRQLHLGGNRAFGDLQATIRGVTELADRYASTGEVLGLGASGGTFGGLSVLPHIDRITRFVALSGPTSLELGGEHENKQVYGKVLAEIEKGRLPQTDIPTLVDQSALSRIDFFLSGENAFDVSQLNHLLAGTDKVVPHYYPTAHHSMTDLCVADGRLIEAVRGTQLAPQQMPIAP